MGKLRPGGGGASGEMAEQVGAELGACRTEALPSPLETWPSLEPGVAFLRQAAGIPVVTNGNVTSRQP